MTPVQIDAMLLANTPPVLVSTTVQNPPTLGLPSVMWPLAPGVTGLVSAQGVAQPHLSDAPTTSTLYERALFDAEYQPIYDQDVRRDFRRAVMIDLDARFAGLTYWPAAAVRSMLGCLDPRTRLYCTDGSNHPLIDPTKISSIRKVFGPPDIPRANPLTGRYDSCAGDPILNYTVHGGDVLAWVSSQG